MSYRSFAVIIYVTEIERQAVMRMYDWSDLTIEGDDQAYKEAFVERDGRRLRIISAQQDEMGMTASAALTTKMIGLFVPEYVIMPGIAAGTGNISGMSGQEYGDVVLASSVWNFSNGKYVSPNESEFVFGDVGFNPRPTVVDISGDYMDRILEYINSDENEYLTHFGPLASGTAVIANETVLKEHVLTRFEGTEGVEMESYGVAYAATHAMNPKPHVIIAKSVCDFADEKKDDMYQQFAAYTSCGLIKDLMEKVLEYTCM